jgi:hypothetical protein
VAADQAVRAGPPGGRGAGDALPRRPALFDTDPAARLAAWKAELDPGSRVNRILDGTDVDGPAGPVPVTWAVDPGVLGTDGAASTGSPGTAPPESDPLVPSSRRW